MERINTDALHFSCPFLRLQEALALPLGELSPQVTERVLQPILNGNVNFFAHTTKIPVNNPVGNRKTSKPRADKNAERSASYAMP